MSDFVTYRAFGAKGDGVSDDFDAICAAHNYANEHHLPVRADAGDTYYIAPHKASAIIRTDTDWTGAAFIIDDSARSIEDRTHQVFRIAREAEESMDLGITSLTRGQTKLPAPGCEVYVYVEDAHIKNYIREGLNQNSGSTQLDCFILHADGTVDPTTPIIWDFPEITRCDVYPIEETPLTLRGGTITTIVNQAPSRYTYYTTGIIINRSNVTVDGLTHYVEGEGEHGAPYNGIIQTYYCVNVTVKNCLFTAHYIYKTIGAADKPVPMGTYDLRSHSAINVLFENCDQTTDIMDGRYWGLFVSDYCKNLTLDGCRFSRFDAHMGVTNATIRNCTLGWQCLNAIGHGLLTVENTTAFGGSFVNLRPDYGSTWNGDVVIRNCTWLPAPRQGGNSLIGGYYHGGHDFGFACHMPHTLTLENVTVQDESCGGISILGNITSANTDDSFVYQYPYHITERVRVHNFRCTSGRPWLFSFNMHMFKDTVLETF